MFKTLASRKLVGVIAAIVGVVGLILGLAVIQPEVFTDATNVVLLAIAGIVGLGGFQVHRQAAIDEIVPDVDITGEAPVVDEPFREV